MLLNAFLNGTWCISPEVGQALLDILAKLPPTFTHEEVKTLMHGQGAFLGTNKNQAESLQTVLSGNLTKTVSISGISSDLYLYQSVAIVPILGVIHPRSINLGSMSSGVTLEELTATLDILCKDTRVRSIVLFFDTPGGDATLVANAANYIKKVDQIKPVYAYIGDLCASAGYWLSSACREIVGSPTASVGSIGAVSVIRTKKSDDKEYYEIVSTQSPYKRVDPSTENGLSYLQERIDKLADIFISSVALNRGLDKQEILNTQGKIFLGDTNIQYKLIDKIQDFTEFLQTLINKDDLMDLEQLTAKFNEMETATQAKFEELQKVSTEQTKVLIEKVEQLSTQLTSLVEKDNKHVLKFLQDTPYKAKVTTAGEEEEYFLSLDAVKKAFNR
jgi:ClpP class serine protease